jgi:Ca-activated chloride channel family protein
MTYRYLRYRPALIAGCILSAVISYNILSGQDNARQDSQLPARISDQTYRVSVDLVNVLCSVYDKNTNSFVTNLMQEDFTIYEDGQRQEIKNFSRETDLPLTIAMLIDTSRSVAPKLKFEQDAATSFFQTILREKDRAMLVEFDSGVAMVQDFTNNPNKLAKGIEKLRAAGGTALYDAIYITCDEKLIRETGRKALIILSDGEDESSNVDLQQATEMALRAEATIFAISISKGGFFGVGGSEEGDTVLKDISKETGGRIFFPFKIEDLDEAFREINQELRSQYSIGYLSTNPARDGSYRKIKINVSEGGLRLNHRKGYYAPKG